jgi:internalin A
LTPTDSSVERRIQLWRSGRTDAALNLTRLGLKAVPERIRGLRNVYALDLSDNEIETLPTWISELRTLEVLLLNRNRVRFLPDELNDLPLEVLGLNGNWLEVLSPEIRRLPLKMLSLARNHHLGIPESILERPPAEILSYYFESRGEKSRPLLEVKLLLVGRGKAGKTSLIRQLAEEKPNPNETETHSIAIRQLFVPCSGGRVRARVWDFGGQEILHSTHQFFLTERSLYLLILEPRTGLAFEDAEYWLRLIAAQGGGSPTIVVLNWSSERLWRVDEVKLRRKFPFIIDFVATDAMTGLGIDTLWNLINKTVEVHMPDVWVAFPDRWRGIKDAVAGMTANFLTHEQYVELCERLDEPRADAQQSLAGILHALGLALYFGNDPRLHDTRVLRPAWVTGGVYAVIRSELVAAAGGRLSAADMAQVLAQAEQQGVVKRADYPPNTHNFILELMRAFQLCYASEEHPGKPPKYLVPELLPEFEPELDDDWERSSIRLRYRYEVVVPPGLLPRFIVNTHALSEGAPHWRHGVVLRHADTQALIREEIDRSEIHVFVQGGNEDTRRLVVGMVRRELDLLHDEMKLQPAEQVELAGEGERWISIRALREIESRGARIQLLPVEPDGTASVDIPQELDKVFSAKWRAADRDPALAPLPVRLFVSYAHEDERKLKRLEHILGFLEQQYGLMPWRDRRLIAGEEWDREIRQRLEEMDVLIFIASQASLTRPYIHDVELRRAQERHRNHEVEIVTVKLEPCGVDEHPFLGRLRRLDSLHRSVNETSLRSRAWEQVRLDLLPVIERARVRKADRLRKAEAI